MIDESPTVVAAASGAESAELQSCHQIFLKKMSFIHQKANMEVSPMAIPEFQSSLTVRVPDDVRSKLDSLSQKEKKPLSRIVRAVIVEGLKQRVASDDDFIVLEA